MTEEEYLAELKRQIREEAKSIQSITILEDWLKKAALEKYEDPRRILKVVKELNSCREDPETPEKKRKEPFSRRSVPTRCARALSVCQQGPADDTDESSGPTAVSLFFKSGSLFRSSILRHPYKNDPQRGPILENYPCDCIETPGRSRIRP